MKVINLFGSAGASKSTTALGLTHLLKINGFKAEYVNEYAKQLVMSESSHMLKHQELVFSNQLFFMNILVDKGLDYIVTDSPLLLAAFYGLKYKTASEALIKLIKEHHNNFDNINYFINRSDEIMYDPVGRNQTEEESKEDSLVLRSYINDFTDCKDVIGTSLLAGYLAYDIIFNH